MIKESDITRLQSQIFKCKSKLESKDFICKAPEEIIKKEEIKLKDFSAVLQSMKRELEFSLMEKYGTREKLQWSIEYYREKICKDWLEEYSSEWFNYIYNPEFDILELCLLNQE